MSRSKPNFTQIPNYFFDCLGSQITGAEYIVLMFMARKIYGWHKEGKGDKISLSQFEKHTPLGQTSIKKALQNLENRNIIIKKSIFGRPSHWNFNYDHIDTQSESNYPPSRNPTGLNSNPVGFRLPPRRIPTAQNKLLKENNINKEKIPIIEKPKSKYEPQTPLAKQWANYEIKENYK